MSTIEGLASGVTGGHRPMTAADAASTADAAAFLFREAQLLDELELEAWLELFDADAVYTMPMGPKGAGTHLRLALVSDDRTRLAERVRRITSGDSYSQNPPSRTLHVVGNVVVVGRTDSELEVRSNQIVVELRHGAQRTFGVECVHRLRHGDDGYRIAAKTLLLLNRDEPLGDLTFIL